MCVCVYVCVCVRACVPACVINLLVCNVIRQNLVLVNVIIDVTYFMSGIYSDFLTYLCGMQDYQSCNEVVDYRLVFKFQFHYYTKFITHAKIKYT